MLRNGEFARVEGVIRDRPLDSSALIMAAQGILGVVRGNPGLAEAQLRRVFDSRADSALRRLAYYGLQTILTEQERYAALETVETRAQAEGISTDTSSLISAQAMRAVGPSRLEFRGVPAVAAAMKPSPLAGCPMVRCRVNGRGSEELWLDTGASLCVISEDLVSRLGIRVLSLPGAKAGTATERKVRFRFGVLDSLECGGLVVRNLPVALMKQSDLNLGIPFLRIPGIIGWPVLARLRTTLDYQNRLATLEPPARRGLSHFSASENRDCPRIFFFGGVPLVQVAIDSAGPLNFIFDTGAQMSMITQSGVDKLLAAPDIVSSPGCIGGAGGGDAKNLRMVFGATLTIADQDVRPLVMPIHKLPTQDFPIGVDGLVGENVFHCFRVELDPTNGVVRLENREGE